jgi:Gram-negative bacterial TonB protein C-terminal
MACRLSCCLLLILIAALAVHSQTNSQPFASLDRAVKAERAGWAGDKSKLSAVFDSERRQLGDKFEPELLKWLGQDPERHYWISAFLEADSYRHGNERLPQLSLLVMEQGLSLVRSERDEESQGYVVRLSITAATLSDELGLRSLATSHKDEGEALLKKNSALSVYVPGLGEADRHRYESIPSIVAAPTVVTDSNPPPKAQVQEGILNGRAVKLVKPVYGAEARKTGASGTIEVRIVFDEAGKVIWARAVSGHPILRTAGEDAAWQSTFPPMKISGAAGKSDGPIAVQLRTVDLLSGTQVGVQENSGLLCSFPTYVRRKTLSR